MHAKQRPKDMPWSWLCDECNDANTEDAIARVEDAGSDWTKSAFWSGVRMWLENEIERERLEQEGELWQEQKGE